jgi:hypothetical protein
MHKELNTKERKYKTSIILHVFSLVEKLEHGDGKKKM